MGTKKRKSLKKSKKTEKPSLNFDASSFGRKQVELEESNRQFEKTQVQLLQALEETEEVNRKLKETQAELMETKKRALLAGISSAVGHEIRNHLTPIVGQLYYINKDLNQFTNFFDSIANNISDTDRKQYYVFVESFVRRFSSVQRSVNRITGVVSTLVNLVRARSEEKGSVELGLVIESAFEEVKFQTYWETLTVPHVVIDIPDDLPFVYGITHDLHGVFVNLIINSLHAMQNVVAKEITVEAKVDPDDSTMVRIDFQDNGCGIQEKNLSKIFEHGFTTKGNDGAGIGLFYCKDNIERVHGGAISVKSKPGHGATFTIRLPIEDVSYKRKTVNR